jgi:hypothetical protein
MGILLVYISNLINHGASMVIIQSLYGCLILTRTDSRAQYRNLFNFSVLYFSGSVFSCSYVQSWDSRLISSSGVFITISFVKFRCVWDGIRIMAALKGQSTVTYTMVVIFFFFF